MSSSSEKESRIYLDHNATTPVDPRVLEAMLPWLKQGYGNASSIHAEGRAARSAIDKAHRQVAALLGAAEEEIYFTSPPPYTACFSPKDEEAMSMGSRKWLMR